MTKPIPINRDICIAQIPGKNGVYGYEPSLAAGVAFCILFGFSMLGHTFTSIRHRTWWQLVFAIGALCETYFSIACPKLTCVQAKFLDGQAGLGHTTVHIKRFPFCCKSPRSSSVCRPVVQISKPDLTPDSTDIFRGGNLHYTRPPHSHIRETRLTAIGPSLSIHLL